MGTIKQSKASKKQWAKLTHEERLKRMAPVIKNRWKGISKAERSLVSKRMHEKRWGKKKKNA